MSHIQPHEKEAFQETISAFADGTNEDFRDKLYSLERPSVFLDWVSREHSKLYYKVLHRITSNHLKEHTDETGS